MESKDEILNLALKMVKKEYLRAISKFGKFNNAHEGYAILLEEVDELWDNVKLNQKISNRNELMLHEAIHVCAMALRFIIDCGGLR